MKINRERVTGGRRGRGNICLDVMFVLRLDAAAPAFARTCADVQTCSGNIFFLTERELVGCFKDGN